MAKQEQIPGTEREINKKVENAGELLVTATKKKTNALKAHKDAESHLLKVMTEEKVKSYTSEDLGKTFEIDDVEKVKVYAWEAPKAKKVTEKESADA